MSDTEKTRKSALKRTREAGKTVRIEIPGGKALRVPRNTPAWEVFKRAKLEPPYPVVAVYFRNKVASINRPMDQAGKLEPIHLGTRDGALIYRRSLTFVLIRAIAELFPSLGVHINHSLNHGYYAELFHRNSGIGEVVPIDQNDVRRIDRRMKEIVENDEPIAREEYTREQAIEMFQQAGMMDKVKLLRYGTNESVSIYRLEDSINHFYGQLAPSTGSLKAFELVLEDPGLVLRFPHYDSPFDVPPREPHVKMRGVLREYEQWMRVLNWRTVAQLNDLIEMNTAREYILIAEALHEKRIANIADTITNHPRKPRVVLLSGPSASGKTTTIKRLSIQLRVNGYRPFVIGLDDYFVDRERSPRDESGEFNFESLYAIDIPRLQEDIRRLLAGEEVQLPKFDFQKGKGFPAGVHRMAKDEILLVEGIHALNDELLPTIPSGQKFKIYASPLTHLNIDDHNRISSSDARLIRRLVRDFNYRGYDAVETLRRWDSVRKGERRNIFPYQENTDVIFNSALPYEFAALKQFAVPVLSRVKRSEPEYSEAARLLKFLSYFRSLKPDFVPRHSLLREFIGGSCFTY